MCVPVRSFGPSRLAIVCASVTLLPRTDVLAAHDSFGEESLRIFKKHSSWGSVVKRMTKVELHCT